MLMNVTRRGFLHGLAGLAGVALTYEAGIAERFKRLEIGELPEPEPVIEPEALGQPVTPDLPLGYIEIDGKLISIAEYSLRINMIPHYVGFSGDDRWAEYVPGERSFDLVVHSYDCEGVNQLRPLSRYSVSTPFRIRPYGSNHQFSGNGIFSGSGYLREFGLYPGHPYGQKDATAYFALTGSGALTYTPLPSA